MSYEERVTAAVRSVESWRSRYADEPSRFPRECVETFGLLGLLGLGIGRADGTGSGLGSAAGVVGRIAEVCPSTATIMQAHYSASTMLDRCGPAVVRAEIAAGRHLAGLALTEPGGTADAFESGADVPHIHGEVVDLRGTKSWVPAAGEADSYLWSSGPVNDAPTSLWVVPANAPGLHVPVGCRTPGLPGAGVAPVTADPVRVPAENLLAAAGGADRQLLSWFVILGAAVSLGSMRGVLDTVAEIAPGSVLERMRAHIDAVRVMLDGALATESEADTVSVTDLLVLRGLANSGAVAVAELAVDVCPVAETPAGARTRRGLLDARAASAVQPAPQTRLERIVPGSERATHDWAEDAGLAATGSSPR